LASIHHCSKQEHLKMPPLCAAAMHTRAACSSGFSFSTRAAPLAARTAAAAAALAAAPRQQRRGSLITPRAFTLEPVDASGNGSGKALEFDQAKVVLGSSAAADVRLPSGDGSCVFCFKLRFWR
jgi:hypothetical protein